MPDYSFGDKLKNKITMPVVMTGLLSFFVTLVYSNVSFGFILFNILLLVFFEYIFKFIKSGKILPYFFMIFSPMLLIHFSSISDFRIRALCFIFILYIFSVPYTDIKRRIDLSEAEKNPALIWLIPFLIFSILSLWLFYSGVHLSGDEPHYLMVTQSIIEDGDFNLRNNVEQKTYMDFIPAELAPHMIIRNGKHLSFHMPGLSILLLPFYLIFKLTGSLIPPQLFFRISISFINAFFAFSLFYLLKYFFPGKKIFNLWLLFVVLYPTLFHSVHIFPELPAATFLIGSFLFIFSKKNNPLTGGLFFSLSIWFHVKYYPPLLIFALFVLIGYIKDKKFKEILKFLIFPAVSSLLLLLYSKALYGTFNPLNIFPPENYWTTPVILKLKVLFSYFLDQRDGLLFYSPLLFLAFFGLKKRINRENIMLFIISIYIFFHAVTTVRGAHSPAGRPLIFVLWIFLIFTANYYFNREDKTFFKLLSGFNFFILFWLLSYPLLVYQPVFASTTERSSGLLKFLGSSMTNISSLFPSFLTHSKGLYMPNIFWILLLAFMIIYFYTNQKGRPEFSKKYKLNLAILFFTGIVFLLSFYPRINLSRYEKISSEGISFLNSSKNFVYEKEKGQFRVRGNAVYDLYFEERKWKKKITFTMEIPPESKVLIKNGRDTIFNSKDKNSRAFMFDLSEINRFKFKNRELIHIGIELKTQSDKHFAYIHMVAK